MRFELKQKGLTLLELLIVLGLLAGLSLFAFGTLITFWEKTQKLQQQELGNRELDWALACIRRDVEAALRVEVLEVGTQLRVELPQDQWVYYVQTQAIEGRLGFKALEGIGLHRQTTLKGHPIEVPRLCERTLIMPDSKSFKCRCHEEESLLEVYIQQGPTQRKALFVRPRM